MNNVKSMAVLLACLSSFYSVRAMESQEKKPSEDYVSRNDLLRFISQGADLAAENKPSEALGFLETAYAQAKTRWWEYGEKDGKLAMVLHGNCERDQTDTCDVEVLTLLLDKVDFLRKRVNGSLKDKATLLLAHTAHKLTRACCGSAFLSDDVEMAWQAQALERSLTMSRAEELAFAQQPGYEEARMELEARKKAEMAGIVRMRESLRQTVMKIAASKKATEPQSDDEDV